MWFSPTEDIDRQSTWLSTNMSARQHRDAEYLHRDAEYRQPPEQLGIATSSLQLMVPRTTVKMSTCFSTRKMRRNAVRSLSSMVLRTTVQMSTSRSSQSAVTQTTARTSTRSIKQQQLREAASRLPELDMQLHQRVITLGDYIAPKIIIENSSLSVK